jgi:hypothetical protein
MGIIIIILGLFLFPAFFFGSIRLLNNRGKEFLQFLLMFVVIFLLILSSWYTIGDITEYDKFSKIRIIRDVTVPAVLFLLAPTFIIAYLLYPFKTMKRSKLLIWILLIYTIFIYGGSAALTIAHAFTNM